MKTTLKCPLVGRHVGRATGSLVVHHKSNSLLKG